MIQTIIFVEKCWNFHKFLSLILTVLSLVELSHCWKWSITSNHSFFVIEKIFRYDDLNEWIAKNQIINCGYKSKLDGLIAITQKHCNPKFLKVKLLTINKFTFDEDPSSLTSLFNYLRNWSCLKSKALNQP